MLIIIGLVLVIASLVFPKSKIVTLLFLLYLWILFGFNTENADTFNYIGIYERIGSGYAWTIRNYEFGFGSLCSFSYNVLKLSYQSFLVLVASICSCLLLINIYLYNGFKNQNYILVLFFLTIYCSMICQYRYYLAFLIFLVGLYFFLETEGLKGDMVFLAFLFLACLFHKATILYGICFLIKKVNLKRIFYLTLLVVVFFIFLRNGYYPEFILNYIPLHKIHYILEDTNRSLLGMAFVFLFRVSLPVIQLMLLTADRLKGLKSELLTFDEYMLKIGVVCTSVIVMEIFDKNFERFFRLPIFLSFIMFSNSSYYRAFRTHKFSAAFLIFLIYFMVYLFYFNYSFQGWISSTVIPIFTKNVLLGY